MTENMFVFFVIFRIRIVSGCTLNVYKSHVVVDPIK